MALSCSIHPQGWVPIETFGQVSGFNSFAPVAFTPKGGCPLKLAENAPYYLGSRNGSIHPQGWVPIETIRDIRYAASC